MAKCYSCGKELGLFSEKTSRKVANNKEKFCLSCAEEWDQKEREKQKQENLAYLFKDGSIKEFFSIPKVRTSELYSQESFSDTVEYFGTLVFTSKAVVFAQFAELKLNKPNKAGSLIGPIGKFGAEVFAAVKDDQLRKRVEAGIRADSKITYNFFDNAKSLIVIPRNKIAKIEFGNFTKRLSITPVDQLAREYYFGLENDKNEIYQEFEARIKNYLAKLDDGSTATEISQYSHEKEKIAAITKEMTENNKTESEISASKIGLYNPKVGDRVVGRIIDFERMMWLVDIEAQSEALLDAHTIVSGQIDISEYLKLLSKNDYVIAEVTSSTPFYELTVSRPELGRVIKGKILKIDIKAALKIADNKDKSLKKIIHDTKSQIIVGMNGTIFLNAGTDKDENSILDYLRKNHDNQLQILDIKWRPKI
jgi:exosome complex RNA-binding protein Rrp4